MPKVCKTCGEELELSEFTPSKRYAQGVLPHCRPCMRKKRPSRVGCKKAIEYSRMYRKEYPEKVAETKAKSVDDWWKRNREKHNARNRDWGKANPHYGRSKTAKRRALKLKATPNWLTQDHYKQIESIYSHAKDCEIVSGEKYHVDHIVPLKGKNICGLHVPWNLQVLPSDLNMIKSNHYSND